MKKPLPKIGVIFLGRRRPGFDMEWGRAMEARARAFLGSEATFSIVEPTEKVIDEPTLRRGFEECTQAGIEALLVLQTTMSDGRLAAALAQRWPHPILLWATPENQQGDMISSCSLVGAHCWAALLRQMDHPFDLIYGAPEEPAVRQRLLEAIRLAVTTRRLRQVRLGMIGGQSPGFSAMGADPFFTQRKLGVQLQSFTLVEFAALANDLPAAAIASDVEQVRAHGLPHQDTSDDDLATNSRLYLALRAFLANENLDAITLREWPELPNLLGQWPYLAVARLAEEGCPFGIEGDVDGALTAWLGESLGFGRAYLTDWLEHDHETITTWHGGAAPFSLCEPAGSPGAPRLARHFNTHKPLVVEATIRAEMPATLVRLWRIGEKFHLTAREGRTVPPKRHLRMTNGLVRLDRQDPHDWFEELCHLGMPHHVTLFAGHHTRPLRRLARSLGIEFV